LKTVRCEAAADEVLSLDRTGSGIGV